MHVTDVQKLLEETEVVSQDFNFIKNCLTNGRYTTPSVHKALTKIWEKTFPSQRMIKQEDLDDHARKIIDDSPIVDMIKRLDDAMASMQFIRDDLMQIYNYKEQQ